VSTDVLTIADSGSANLQVATLRTEGAAV